MWTQDQKFVVQQRPPPSPRPPSTPGYREIWILADLDSGSKVCCPTPPPPPPRHREICTQLERLARGTILSPVRGRLVSCFFFRVGASLKTLLLYPPNFVHKKNMLKIRIDGEPDLNNSERPRIARWHYRENSTCACFQKSSLFLSLIDNMPIESRLAQRKYIT